VNAITAELGLADDETGVMIWQQRRAVVKSRK